MSDILRVHTMIRIEITKSVDYGDYQVPEGEKPWVEFSIEPDDYLEITEEQFNHIKFNMRSPEFQHEVELTYEEVEKMAYGLLEMVRIHKAALR